MSERFALIERIGRGGMGTVWKARDLGSGEVVALKILHEHLADDEDVVTRFEREVEVTRRIDSPYVAKTLGFGRREGRPFISMEFVEGQSLRDLLRDSGPMPWEQASRLLRQVALGLDAAHAAGVIHRDIKPSNILITGDGTAKLVDFGIARATDLTAITGTSTTMGTPAYMSPDGVTGPQSDLYALGCVAFELLTGEPPFTGESPQEVVIKHIREQPDLSRLPEPARPAVGWLLKKRLDERAPSASLAAAVFGGTSTIPRPARARRAPRSRTLFAGLAGVGILGVAGLTVGWAFVGGDGEQVAGTPSSVVSAVVPSISPASSPTAAPTDVATNTPTATPTDTPVPTATATPTQTPTLIAPNTQPAVVTAPATPSTPPSETATASRGSFVVVGPTGNCPGDGLIVSYTDVTQPTQVSGRYDGQTVVEVGTVLVGGPGATTGTLTFPTYNPLTPGTYRLSVFVAGATVASGSLEIRAC